MISYRPFNLLITSRDDGYLVRVLDSPAGQAEAVLSLDFDEQELAALKGIVPVDQIRLTPHEVGQRLFESLFNAEVEISYRVSLKAVEPDGGLRINLRFDRAPELAVLPWETLYDPVTGSHLALTPRTPLVRYIQLPQAESDLPVLPPLRILALIANPVDSGALLDVEAEWREIEAALRPLTERGHVVLERGRSATLAFLQDRMRAGGVHVLHYIGHAVYDPSAGSGFVLLEDADGNGQPVSEAQLQAILRDQAGLRLVYLNACEGAQNSGVDNFTGIAQTLVQAGVPAVIGMMQTVGDGTAAQLAGEFYESVAEGYPVDAALAEARKAIFLQDGDLSWGLPVLFSRSRDNRLIAAPEQETQPLMVVPSKSMWQRPLLWIALLVIAVLVTTAIAVLSPADSRFGWFQAAGDQNNCRADRTGVTCILASQLTPGNSKASQVATRLLVSSLRDAVDGFPFSVIPAQSVVDRQEALALGKRYAAPVIVWGEVFEGNDLYAKVHLELVDRLGIAQGADLEPYRLQHLPVDNASITVDFSCEGEADCLGPETGRLARSAPEVAGLAKGLASYSERRIEEARSTIEPLAACILEPEQPTCQDSLLLPHLEEETQSLLLYYTGRIYGMQQDYERALLYLNASRELAPDNPAPAIAAGWMYLNWGGSVTPTEAEDAFADAQFLLGVECRANDSSADAGERLYSLGVIHEMREEWQDAEACYALAADTLAARDDDPYPVLINLARVQRQGGRTEAARENIAKAHQLAPNLPWATLELARLHADDEAAARRHLEEAMANYPATLQVQTTVAELCEAWGDRECAESAYGAARSLRPDYGWLLEKIGQFYSRQQDWSQAEAYIKQTMDLGAHNPWTYERLGAALLGQQKYPEAAGAYRQAVDSAYSDESVRHLFCPLSGLLAQLAKDDEELLEKCVAWSEDDNQRDWAEQRLLELSQISEAS